MTLFNPFGLWSDYAMKTGEMMLASASVISHRTQRMAQASLPPSAVDQREFTRMGQEKVAAMAESAQDATVALFGVGPAMALKATQQMMTLSADMLSLATSTTPQQAVARQLKLSRRLMDYASSGASQAGARVAHAALNPVHKRATANAKRLNKL